MAPDRPSCRGRRRRRRRCPAPGVAQGQRNRRRRRLAGGATPRNGGALRLSSEAEAGGASRDDSTTAWVAESSLDVEESRSCMAAVAGRYLFRILDWDGGPIASTG